MSSYRMYGDRADLYDKIYAKKDYAVESQRIHDILAAVGIADGEPVVEAACGTGAYLAHLSRWYDVSGFDRSDEMLEVARRRVPRVPVWRTDFESFSVAAPVSAVVCLFSSIAYVKSATALRKTAEMFFASVRSGGAVIVEPFVAPQEFRDGAPHLDVYEDDNLKVVRAVVSHARGAVASVNFHWLVARAGAADVEYFIDPHELRMFDRSELADAFTAAGFSVHFERPGRDLLLVGVKGPDGVPPRPPSLRVRR